MKGLAFLFSLFAFATTGCALAPLESRQPYKEVTVDQPLRQVYKNLKAYPYCGKTSWRQTASIDPEEGTFEIYFVNNSPLNQGGAPTDLIIGQTIEGGKTRLKMISWETWITPISQEFVNRLQTGRCDG